MPTAANPLAHSIAVSIQSRPPGAAVAVAGVAGVGVA